MWYPDKAAFRCGFDGGSKWNKDSIGNYSVAMGSSTKASGSYSTAFGYRTTASGGYSFAVGYKTTASGNESFAMGFLATASGSVSTAIGYGTKASGQYATAMGSGAKATGDYSFAINLSSSATAPEVGASMFRISGASEIGGNVPWTNYSDKRLKTDIQYIQEENNLDKIGKLNGIRFKWKEKYNDYLNLGFIAQEVKEIIPEVVRYDEVNDIYTMEYTGLIPVLVEAIKEQQKVIAAQQNMIRQHKIEIEELRNLSQQQQVQINRLLDAISNK